MFNKLKAYIGNLFTPFTGVYYVANTPWLDYSGITKSSVKLDETKDQIDRTIYNVRRKKPVFKRKFSNGVMDSMYGFGHLKDGEGYTFQNDRNESGDQWYKRIQTAASAYGRYNDKQFQTRYKDGVLTVKRIR